MKNIKLYDAANSPCGRRVRMTLIEKGIPFEIHWINLALMDQKQQWYLKLNPNGLVPTFVQDEYAVYESNVINEYIEALAPMPRLMPQDDRGKAEVRMWLAFEAAWAGLFRDVLYETFAKERLKANLKDPSVLDAEITKRTDNPFYAKFARQVLSKPRNDELVEDRLNVLFERMALMEARLSDGREWLVGDEVTFADLGLTPRIDMYPLIGVGDIYERFPRIGAFVDRVKARPSWDKSNIAPTPGEPTTQVLPS